MMRFVAIAATKDLRRRLADPIALVIWVGIPLLLGGFMSLVTGSDAAPPRAHVLVVDDDQSQLTTLIANSGSRGGSNPFDIEVVSREDGFRRIDAGDATALLILPKGFQEAVLNDTPTRLELIENPAQRILPRIVEEALRIVVEGVFYTQRLVGDPIRATLAERSGGDAVSNAQAISGSIAERVQSLQRTLFPPAMTLTANTVDPDARQSLGFAQLYLPGILFMSFLFIAQGMSGDVWDERTAGTLKRLLTTPRSAAQLLAGKLVAGMVLIAAISGIALVAAVALFDIAWTRVPLALVWSMFAGGALLALMMLLQTAAGSERGANLLGTFVTFPLMMIGGSFFPFENMPAWMVRIGQWTPNGVGVTTLKGLLYGAPAASTVLSAALAVGVPAALAFVVASRRLRAAVANG